MASWRPIGTDPACRSGLPTLAVAAELGSYDDGHMRRVAQTELLRGQNRNVAAITQARQIVDVALE